MDAILLNDKPTDFNREVQIVSVSKGVGIEPGQEVKVQIKYHGPILELAAHLEVDQKRYETANDYLIFSLPKKYAYLEDDYALLTKDVMWYPDTEVGYNRISASKERQSFIDFELSAKALAGTMPISQGEVNVTINFHRMTPHTYWLGLCLLVLCINQPAYSADIWLSNAQLIDGTGKTEIRSVNVRVTDNRIVEITEASTRSGAIDLQRPIAQLRRAVG